VILAQPIREQYAASGQAADQEEYADNVRGYGRVYIARHVIDHMLNSRFL